MIKTNRRKGTNNGVKRQSFDDLLRINREDLTALFNAGWTGWNQPRIELTDEIKNRHALALQTDRNSYLGIARGIYDALGNGAVSLAPARVRGRINAARSAFEQTQRGSFSPYEPPPFFTTVDELVTGTTLFDGGSFFKGRLELPGNVSVPLRIKKYGDPKKFKRGLPVQRFLRRLAREGYLNSEIRINEPAYIDEINGLHAELHIEGRRLIDVLREARSDEERAALLAPVVKDYVEISVRATEYRDLKVDRHDARKIGFNLRGGEVTDEETHYLKRQEGKWGWLRNRLPGNYVLPKQGAPTDNFLKLFALRAKPHLRNRFLKENGEVEHSGLLRAGISEDRALQQLSNAWWGFVHKDFRKRRKYIVNLDANTSQVMVTSDGRRVYTDWDHSYFGLIEEQLAEMLITSSIKDENQLESLVDAAYGKLIELTPYAMPQGNRADFGRVVDKKIVEKLLGRAARFKDVSRRIEDTREQQTLDDLANQAYTLALRRLDKIEKDAEKSYSEIAKRTSWNVDGPTPSQKITYVREAIRAFNAEHLGLKEVEDTEGITANHETVGTIISSINDLTPLEGMKSDYRLAHKPIDWKKIQKTLKGTAIASAIVFGAAYMTENLRHYNKINELETAAKYSGKEISIVDPHYDEQMIILNSWESSRVQLPRTGMSIEDIICAAYEVKDRKEKEFFIDWIENNEIVRARQSLSFDEEEKKIDEDAQRVADEVLVDKELIKAIVRAGGLPALPTEYVGPMKIKVNSEFFTRRYEPSDLASNSYLNMRAGAEYLRQCVAHNEGNLPDSLTEYFVGVYEMQRAMISVGSKNYADYRGELPSWAIQRIDGAIADYLEAKDVWTSASKIDDE